MKKEKINLFDVIPCISEGIRTEENMEGLSVIAFPRFKSKFMQKYMIPKGMSPFFHMTLDKQGTKVWGLIDGKRTVREIVVLLDDYFNHEENYESRITKFLTQLRDKEAIKFIIKKKG